jgi:predicted dinucleotide-binding enzyme
MKIATIGRGNVGGGLADLWEQAGHEVTRLGREGGDVSEAEVVLVAVPGGAIEAALENVRGLEGRRSSMRPTSSAPIVPPGFSRTPRS